VFDISSSEDQPFSPVLEEMGYETHNVLLNMGSLYVYFSLFTSGLVLMGILKIVKSFVPLSIIDKLYLKLKDTIFWGSFLILFTEGYLEILISAYLNTLSSVNYTSSDEFSFVMSYLLIVIQVFVLPAAYIYMLTRPS